MTLLWIRMARFNGASPHLVYAALRRCGLGMPPLPAEVLSKCGSLEVNIPASPATRK
jgi:hypothetical protein